MLNLPLRTYVGRARNGMSVCLDQLALLGQTRRPASECRVRGSSSREPEVEHHQRADHALYKAKREGRSCVRNGGRLKASARRGPSEALGRTLARHCR